MGVLCEGNECGERVGGVVDLFFGGGRWRDLRRNFGENGKKRRVAENDLKNCGRIAIAREGTEIYLRKFIWLCAPVCEIEGESVEPNLCGKGLSTCRCGAVKIVRNQNLRDHSNDQESF